VLGIVGIVVALSGPCDAAVWGGRQQSLGGFKVVVQLIVELLEELVADGDEGRGRVDNEHQEQQHAVPGGQPHANRRGGHQGSPSFKTNPTPRTVWMRRAAPSASTFLRRRAIWTSITLSSGVARRGSFHTSRASISRDTKWP